MRLVSHIGTLLTVSVECGVTDGLTEVFLLLVHMLSEINVKMLTGPES